MLSKRLKEIVTEKKHLKMGVDFKDAIL